MTTQIVFIRHGIAEARAPDLTDFSRRLTKKGAQKLRDALPQLAALLHLDWDVQIWSSPLVRARQTADIAADIFRVQEVIIHDFIGKGDYAGFKEAFEKLNPSIHHTVMVVGHEPHAGNWSQTLCGVLLPFKKGAAASFVIGSGGIESAELEWFLQPESMERLSIVTHPPKILFGIQENLLMLIHQVILGKDVFLADPRDTETTHQLRVSIRKLRSLLSFIKPFQKGKQNTEMQKCLKKFMTRFSYLRELDVMREAIEIFCKYSPEAINADSIILAKMDQERDDEANRVMSSVSDPGTDSSLRNLEKALQTVKWKDNVDVSAFASSNINDRFAHLLHAFKRKARTIDYHDAVAAHALRIEAKKLRYSLSGIEPLLDAEHGTPHDELKQMHDKLGKLCDARRNKEILQKFDNGDLPESVHSEIRAFSDYQDLIIKERIDLLKESRSLFCR